MGPGLGMFQQQIIDARSVVKRFKPRQKAAESVASLVSLGQPRLPNAITSIFTYGSASKATPYSIGSQD